MRTSVIIPTYNGAQKLPVILKAIEQQSLKPDEIVVAVDGSIDNTAEVLAAFSSRMDNLKVVFQENQGRAAIRNKGVRNASGDLLVFFDDDMRPLPQCIEQHVRFHNQNPGGILTGGLTEEVQASSPDFLQFKSYLSTKWNSSLVGNNQMPLSKDQIFITAANCSMMRETFVRLGGFDDRLMDAEDFDLAVRAFEAGVHLYFNPQAFSWHDDQVNCTKYIKRLRQYAVAQLKLRELKPDLYAQHPKFSKPEISKVKQFFFLFFARWSWIKMADSGRLLNALPRKLRYRLYDYIVTANGVYFPEKVKL